MVGKRFLKDKTSKHGRPHDASRAIRSWRRKLLDMHSIAREDVNRIRGWSNFEKTAAPNATILILFQGWGAAKRLGKEKLSTGVDGTPSFAGINR